MRQVVYEVKAGNGEIFRTGSYNKATAEGNKILGINYENVPDKEAEAFNKKHRESIKKHLKGVC